MDSTRREFIKQAGATALGATAIGTAGPELAFAAQKAAAKPKQAPTLIAVYLRGGADMLGIVVPYSDKDYPKVHPTLAMSESEVLHLDNNFGFNPNMKELHALYEKGMCVPIVCTGSPHPTRSHFDAQDFMERGAPGLRAVDNGWLNRYLYETKTSKDANLRAISLQSLLPRSLRGDYPVLAKPDQNAEQALEFYSQLYMPQMGAKPAGGSGASPPNLRGQQTKQAIKEFGARTIEQLRELDAILDQKTGSSGLRYPTSGFGRQLRDIAKVIKANRGLEVTALDIGGWDHHINEGPTNNGTLARMVGDVSASIGAFTDDLGPLMSSVLILVMTEFGRTVRENGNRGTDHGHGGFMLAIGGGLTGKKVYGKWEGLADDKLNEHRDLPVHTDFRVVFAEGSKARSASTASRRACSPNTRPIPRRWVTRRTRDAMRAHEALA